MNIFPKELDLHDGSTSCTFNIHNTSNQSKLLLYKIRRSEPQLVTFYPKHGVVKPGEMHEVELNLVNEEVAKAKVLVKVVIINANLINKRNHHDFELIWTLGAQSSSVMKRVVKVTNMTVISANATGGSGVTAGRSNKYNKNKNKKKSSRYQDDDEYDEEDQRSESEREQQEEEEEGVDSSSMSMSAESVLTESDESALLNTPSPKKMASRSSRSGSTGVRNVTITNTNKGDDCVSSYADGFADRFNAHIKPAPAPASKPRSGRSNSSSSTGSSAPKSQKSVASPLPSSDRETGGEQSVPTGGEEEDSISAGSGSGFTISDSYEDTSDEFNRRYQQTKEHVQAQRKAQNNNNSISNINNSSQQQGRGKEKERRNQNKSQKNTSSNNSGSSSKVKSLSLVSAGDILVNRQRSATESTAAMTHLAGDSDSDNDSDRNIDREEDGSAASESEEEEEAEVIETPEKKKTKRGKKSASSGASSSSKHPAGKTTTTTVGGHSTGTGTAVSAEGNNLTEVVSAVVLQTLQQLMGQNGLGSGLNLSASVDTGLRTHAKQQKQRHHQHQHRSSSSRSRSPEPPAAMRRSWSGCLSNSGSNLLSLESYNSSSNSNSGSGSSIGNTSNTNSSDTEEEEEEEVSRYRQSHSHSHTHSNKKGGSSVRQQQKPQPQQGRSDGKSRSSGSHSGSHSHDSKQLHHQHQHQHHRSSSSRRQQQQQQQSEIEIDTQQRQQQQEIDTQQRQQQQKQLQQQRARVVSQHAHHEAYMRYMAVLAEISAMRHIAGQGADVVVEVKGAAEQLTEQTDNVASSTDAVIHDALEWRIGHILLEEEQEEMSAATAAAAAAAVVTGGRVNHSANSSMINTSVNAGTHLVTKRNMTLDIQYTPLVSLMEGIGNLFVGTPNPNTAGVSPYTELDEDGQPLPQVSEAEQKLRRIQYVLSNQQIRHVIINHTAVKLLQVTALNRFNHLQTLDLSSNNITSITNGMLSLPMLTHLDLSNNMLKSLDFLQELQALKVLNASSNKIASLTMSVHMLLPLADNLVNLDLSLNPVAYHQRYCEEVLDVCPRIEYLDGRDLAVLHEQNAVKKHSSTGGGTPGGAGSPSSSPGNNTTTGLSPEDIEFENRLKRVLKHKEYSEIKKEMQSTTSKSAAGEERTGSLSRSLNRPTPVRAPSPAAFGQRSPPSPPASRRYSPPTTSVTTPMTHTNNNSSYRIGNSAANREPPKSPNNAANISHISVASTTNASSLNNTLNNVSMNSTAPVDHLGGLKNKKKPVSRMSISYNPADPLYKTAVHDRPGEAHGVDSGASMNANPYTNAGVNNTATASPSPLGRSGGSISGGSAFFNGSNAGGGGASSGNTKSSGKSPAVSASLLSLTGSQKLRRQSYGIVESHSEHMNAVRLAEEQERQWEREQTRAQYDSDTEGKIKVHSSAPGTPGTPSFMKGTSSTRCRRASFDLHCLDQAGGSLSAAGVLHRSYLNDTEANSPEGRARIANASSFTSTLGSVKPKYSQDPATMAMSERLFKEGVSNAPMKELVEDERFSIWHPRYRRPVNGVHGYSKPFSKSVQLKKGLAPHPPLFEKTVLRMRDGFQKLPLRGTFTRASKGLTAEWYPMDVQDLEAIRRRGYFHETIGDIQKYSYRDFSTMMIESGAAASGDMNQSSTVLERSGSQLLAATKNNRRGSMGQHVSRQYASTEKLVDEDHRFRDPEDTYSGFMKWDTRAAAVAITDTMKKRRSSVSSRMSRSMGSISDTHSMTFNNDNNLNGNNDSPTSFNYQRGNYDEEDNHQHQQNYDNQDYQSWNQQQHQQQQQQDGGGAGGGQPLSVNTNLDRYGNPIQQQQQLQQQGDDSQQHRSIYQNTSNFVPFTSAGKNSGAGAGTGAGEPKPQSYISSLFGKLGMDQPEIPTASSRSRELEQQQQQQRILEASEAMDDAVGAGAGGGYTSDPGYSSKYNGNSRYEQLKPAADRSGGSHISAGSNSATVHTNADANANANVAPVSEPAPAPESALALGAHSGDEQQQIDAYLAWLEAQETEGGKATQAQSSSATAATAGGASHISVDAMQDRSVQAVREATGAGASAFVPNDLHLQQGLDDVKEEKWETKLRLAQERKED